VIDDLAASSGPFVAVRSGVVPDARHVGRINLFRRTFGTYPQDIVLRMRHGPVAAG